MRTLLEVTDIFIFLFVVIISQVHTYAKTYQLLQLKKCSLLYESLLKKTKKKDIFQMKSRHSKLNSYLEAYEKEIETINHSQLRKAIQRK